MQRTKAATVVMLVAASALVMAMVGAQGPIRVRSANGGAGLALTTVTLTPVADASIDRVSGNVNLGGQHTLEVQYLSSRQVRRSPPIAQGVNALVICYGRWPMARNSLSGAWLSFSRWPKPNGAKSGNQKISAAS